MQKKIKEYKSLAANINLPQTKYLAINYLQKLKSPFHLKQSHPIFRILVGSSFSAQLLAFALWAFLVAPCFVGAQNLTIESGGTLNLTGDGSEGYKLTVTGNIDVADGGALNTTGDAVIELKGDINLRSTAAFEHANSTLILNGSAAQNINLLDNAFDERLYNLTINNTAGVSLNAANTNTKLYINNILTPESGTFTTNGDLILRNTSTIRGRVAHGAGTILGEVRVEKLFLSGFAGWRQLSLPVQFSLSSGTTNWDDFTNRLGILLDGYTPAIRLNTYVYDATDADGLGGSDYAKSWRPATYADNHTQAFNIYLSNNADLSAWHYFGSGSLPNHIEVDGQLQQGDFNNTLYYTRDTADGSGTNPSAVGWNFIANPWAAYIDVDALLNDNVNFTSGYKAVHVWDATNATDNAGQYRAIVNGITKTDYNTNGGDIDATGGTQTLDMFQGFWVKATADAQVCNLIASTMQTTTYQGEKFNKKQPDLLRLNVFDADSSWEQLVVYFDESTTSNFDNHADAYYLTPQNLKIPRFFAFEGGYKAAIVGRNPEISDSLVLSFSSFNSSNLHHLNADFSQLPTGWQVFLRDRATQKNYALNHNFNLAFNQQTGDVSNRFVIYFSQNTNAFNHLVTGNSNIDILRSESGLLLLPNGATGTAQVSVFDIVGKCIYRTAVQLKSGESTHLPIHTNDGMLLVKTEIDGNTFVNKVIY